MERWILAFSADYSSTWDARYTKASTSLDQRTQIYGIRYFYTGLTYEEDGVTPHWRGIYDDDGRLMVVGSTNVDYGQTWIWNMSRIAKAGKLDDQHRAQQHQAAAADDCLCECRREAVDGLEIRTHGSLSYIPVLVTICYRLVIN